MINVQPREVDGGGRERVIGQLSFTVQAAQRGCHLDGKQIGSEQHFIGQSSVK
ncbi:hypothetical protein J2D78_14725 [Microbacterium maritypicum]|uniref:hypothetical protein n=1 Tax=Microbacterium maritypicum TaxID=33918 RepID=UPI001B337512|nr:hypothetical protein [Microbacterium liquefaciens]MBP5803340.1 hypothetical protein [Microbacterium liquefaciens]